MADQPSRARKVINSLTSAFNGESDEDRKAREEEERKKREAAAQAAAQQQQQAQGSPARQAVSNYFKGQ